jgi:hypothetical protein
MRTMSNNAVEKLITIENYRYLRGGVVRYCYIKSSGDIYWRNYSNAINSRWYMY